MLLSGLLLSMCLWGQINLFGLHYSFTNPSNPAAGGWQEFVQINPYTGSYIVLDTVRGVEGVIVGASTFDHGNGSYIFWGIDQQQSYNFYQVDRISGSSRSFPSTKTPIEIQYDMNSGFVYGLDWDEITQQERFVKTDLSTGAVTTVSVLRGVKAVALGASALDDDAGRYYFVGYDTNDAARLYRIELSTGNILSQNLLTNTLYELEYDVSQKKLLALHRANLQSPPQLVEVDTVTGSASPIVDITSLNGQFSGFSIGAVVFDQNSHTYIFRGLNSNTDSIYFVDAIQRTYRAIPSPGNVIEIECDNTAFAKQYFGSTTAISQSFEPFSIAPNPTQDWLEVSIPKGSKNGMLAILDMQGRTIQRIPFNQNTKRINLSDLSNGTYVLMLQAKGKSYRSRLVKH